MRFYEMFIDELGQANPLSSQSEVYVLCGCVIERSDKEETKIKADQIKYKYWGKTDIVFHSREIGKDLNNFAIFQGKQELKKNFESELLEFLKNSNVSIFIIVVDNQIAKEKGWNSVKLIQETSRKLFYHFIVWLLGMGNARGKVNVESATAEKDRFYLNEFSYFLAPGCRELTVDYKVIQEIFISISFVTKRNHDIEEQIADLFAYAAKCKYMRATGKKTYKVGSYEDKMIRVLDSKLFQKPKVARAKKMKFYETIDPFCIIPKT